MKSESELLRLLHVYNPWWIGKPIPAAILKEFKRRDYYKLEGQLENDKIVALIGARRVGKTTLMYQLIEKILSQTSPQNILFAVLDNPSLQITQDTLEQIFKVYTTSVLKKQFDSADETIYIFLDEVQALKNWQQILKSWWDLKYKIKFIISGSSSIDIIDGTAESLVGRIAHQIVMPMKFLEFVRFKEQKIGESLHYVNRQLRESLKTSILKKDIKIFYDALSRSYNDLISHEGTLNSLLQEYLIKGGYPENVGIDDLVICGTNLRHYLELTLYKDIMKTGKVRDPVALESLFTILARESSNRINISDLANTLDIERYTLNSYIYLLESAFLVFGGEYYAKSVEKRKRRLRKIYVHDVGIRNVSSSVLDESVLQNNDEMGTIVETVAADHTKRLKFNMESTVSPDIFYWFDSHEVDLVIELFHVPLPIEVKYRESVDLSRLSGLQKFSEKFKNPVSIAITKNQLELHNSIVFIPLWVYLIMC